MPITALNNATVARSRHTTLEQQTNISLGNTREAWRSRDLFYICLFCRASFSMSLPVCDRSSVGDGTHINNNASIDNETPSGNKTSFDRNFRRIIEQAVQDFEEILGPCVTPSAASLAPSTARAETAIETKKRDCEDFLRPLRKQTTVSVKPSERKFDCRKWCDEQNRRLAKHSQQDDSNRPEETSRSYRSTARKIPAGSTFHCRKALIQRPNGTTYICIRKRLD